MCVKNMTMHRQDGQAANFLWQNVPYRHQKYVLGSTIGTAGLATIAIACWRAFRKNTKNSNSWSTWQLQRPKTGSKVFMRQNTLTRACTQSQVAKLAHETVPRRKPATQQWRGTPGPSRSRAVPSKFCDCLLACAHWQPSHKVNDNYIVRCGARGSTGGCSNRRRGTFRHPFWSAKLSRNGCHINVEKCCFMDCVLLTQETCDKLWSKCRSLGAFFRPASVRELLAKQWYMLPNG